MARRGVEQCGRACVTRNVMWRERALSRLHFCERARPLRYTKQARRRSAPSTICTHIASCTSISRYLLSFPCLALFPQTLPHLHPRGTFIALRINVLASACVVAWDLSIGTRRLHSSFVGQMDNFLVDPKVGRVVLSDFGTAQQLPPNTWFPSTLLPLRPHTALRTFGPPCRFAIALS